MKFSITYFFSKCDQISSFQRFWSHLLRKSVNGKLNFLCSVMSKVADLERECSENNQYTWWECLEISHIPESIGDN